MRDIAAPVLYTIGHSNRPFDALLHDLQAHAIDMIADVRTRPMSRFAPHFNRRALEASFAAASIRYEFLGESLGGRPSDPGLYDQAGHVRYDEVSRTQAFQTGIAVLRATAARGRLAIMCSEEDPARCHRHLLIARVLVEEGVDPTRLMHVRAGGELVSEADLAGPPRLLEAAWRSPEPVLRRR